MIVKSAGTLFAMSTGWGGFGEDHVPSKRKGVISMPNAQGRQKFRSKGQDANAEEHSNCTAALIGRIALLWSIGRMARAKLDITI